MTLNKSRCGEINIPKLIRQHMLVCLLLPMTFCKTTHFKYNSNIFLSFYRIPLNALGGSNRNPIERVCVQLFYVNNDNDVACELNLEVKTCWGLVAQVLMNNFSVKFCEGFGVVLIY